jgi:hypothetical protein
MGDSKIGEGIAELLASERVLLAKRTPERIPRSRARVGEMKACCDGGLASSQGDALRPRQPRDCSDGESWLAEAGP